MQGLIIFGSVAAFGVGHSLLASRRFKAHLQHKLGERFILGWYRLIYNIISVVTLLPAVYFSSILLPDRLVYQVRAPWSFLMILVQLGGLLGLLVSVSQTGAWRFMGVTQVLEFLSGQEPGNDDTQLVTGGLYRIVRHPLYFFSFILIWFSPTQTINSLALAAAFTIYFMIGSLFEEKRLIKAYGEAYIAYKQHTPWLIPNPLRIIRTKS